MFPCDRIRVSSVTSQVVASALLVALLMVAGEARGGSVYEAAMARAAALEKAGKPADAAAALQAIEGRFRQDYTLQLRLGWLHFAADDHRRSERHYRRALALSPDSLDAHHGLAWALLRQGKRDQARSRFSQVLQRWPETRLARLGLTLATQASQRAPLLSLQPTAYVSGQVYQDHLYKSSALSSTVSLPVQLLTHGVLNVTYRYSNFWTTDYAQSLGLSETFDQHELYLTAGVSHASFGVTAQYAYINDGSGYLDDSHLLGLTARYSPWGDITLATSVGLYSDITVVSISPAWRLPLLSWLSLTPALHVQVASADSSSLLLSGDSSKTLVAGSLTITAHGEAGSLWLGGRYGDMVRHADLNSAVVYNTADRSTFGLWAGGKLNLSDRWSVFLSYQLDGQDTPISTSQSSSSLTHVFSGGVSLSF